MFEPEVSVVIPAYNAEKFLTEAVDSVIKQTYSNWEIIIVNDCSSDGTREIIQGLMNSDDRIKAIDNFENFGVSYTRNIGVEMAKGRYICFLDSDDKWLPCKLEKQIEFMKENKVGFSFTAYEFADINGMPKGKRVFVPNRVDYDYLLKRNIIWTCTVMFDLTLIDKKDLVMPRVNIGEDTATWRKVVKKYGYAFGLNQILSYYRRGGVTLSSNKFKSVWHAWRNYRVIEGLSLCKTTYYFSHYLVNAIARRV